MKRSFLDSVLRGAEVLAARDPVGTLPDRELLARFTANRDPAAFTMVVRRHGPLVWGVCRNLLADDADAEDAFQATFLALVRSAPTIRRTEALGGWLHGVAYRVALKARRSAVRRRTHEKKAAVAEADSPVPDAAWDELQAAVHEEVCKLPDKLRLPFVLCGLQGRAQKVAAKELGWTIGTLSGRLSEARRKLLDRLARRGVPVGVAIGAAVLGGVAGGASVPSVLLAKVLSAAGTPDAVSPSILSLARGVTHVYLTRTKLLAASIVLAGLLTTGIGANVLSRADAQGSGRNPEPTPDSVKRAIDYLRTRHLDYKFVPIEKPLATTDLQKLLAVADEEGWDYCGAQDLVQEKTEKVMPHMVFKRSRAVAAVPSGRDEAAKGLAELAERQAAVAALAKAHQQEATARERTALDELAKAREMAVAEQRAKAEAAVRDVDTAKRRSIDREDADQARLLELKAMQEKYEELIRQMQLQLQKAKLGDSVKAANIFGVAPDTLLSVNVKLANVDGKTAAAGLAKVLPQAKIVAEVRPDSITLTGTPKQIDEARAIIQKSIDVKAEFGVETSKGVNKDIEILAIALKSAKASEVASAITKVLGNSKGSVAVDEKSNTLYVAGTPQVLDVVKKAVAEMEAKVRPPK